MAQVFRCPNKPEAEAQDFERNYQGIQYYICANKDCGCRMDINLLTGEAGRTHLQTLVEVPTDPA